MHTRHHFLQIILIALTGLFIAGATFLLSLWITEHPHSLASTLPMGKTIVYVRTTDASTLKRYITRFHSLENGEPIPAITPGTRYEFAIINDHASYAWMLSTYKGKIEGEVQQSSKQWNDLLQKAEDSDHAGFLSQSSLFRKFAPPENLTMVWMDTAHVPLPSSPGGMMMKALLLRAPHLLLTEDTDGNGSIVLENVRLPWGIRRENMESVTKGVALSLEAQNIQSVISLWLTSIDESDPSLREGLRGIIAGVGETWGIDDTMTPLIRRILSMPLSFSIVEEKNATLTFVIGGTIPVASDRTLLMSLLHNRGGNGTIRQTALMNATTVTDVIDDVSTENAHTKDGWSVQSLGGSPALWIALKNSSFLIATSENALMERLGTSVPSSADQHAYLTAMIDKPAFASLAERLLPFLADDLHALKKAGLIPEGSVEVSVESVNDATMIRWSDVPPDVAIPMPKDQSEKKS